MRAGLGAAGHRVRAAGVALARASSTKLPSSALGTASSASGDGPAGALPRFRVLCVMSPAASLLRLLAPGVWFSFGNTGRAAARSPGMRAPRDDARAGRPEGAGGGSLEARLWRPRSSLMRFSMQAAAVGRS